MSLILTKTVIEMSGDPSTGLGQLYHSFFPVLLWELPCHSAASFVSPIQWYL